MTASNQLNSNRNIGIGFWPIWEGGPDVWHMLPKSNTDSKEETFSTEKQKVPYALFVINQIGRNTYTGTRTVQSIRPLCLSNNDFFKKEKIERLMREGCVLAVQTTGNQTILKIHKRVKFLFPLTLFEDKHPKPFSLQLIYEGHLTNPLIITRAEIFPKNVDEETKSTIKKIKSVNGYNNIQCAVQIFIDTNEIYKNNGEKIPKGTKLKGTISYYKIPETFKFKKQ